MKNKAYVKTLEARIRQMEKTLALASSICLFLDFVYCTVSLYRHIESAQFNLILGSCLYAFRGVFALGACVCMIMLALSFGKRLSYDFNRLSLLNAFPLLWSMFNGFFMLVGFEQKTDFDSIIYYITVFLSIIGLYRFALQVERNDSTDSKSTLCFMLYGAFGVFNFICCLCEKKSITERLVPSAAMMMCGIFLLALSIDAIRKTLNNKRF